MSDYSSCAVKGIGQLKQRYPQYYPQMWTMFLLDNNLCLHQNSLKVAVVDKFYKFIYSVNMAYLLGKFYFCH